MQAFWQQCEGQLVDGFELQKYLGGSDDHGVFLTERNAGEPQRAVIKLVHADPETNEEQLRHWRMAAALSHPNLLGIFERGHWQVNNVPVLYLVMEYAGERLSQVVAEGALTPDEAREMLEPALKGLTYLHAKGFVHGRLRTSNILAVGDQLKLSSDEVTPIAATGPKPSDDVWALGLTLVEATTQLALDTSSSGRGDPALPPTLPAEFREIARNALRTNPDKRWTVAHIQQSLRGETGRSRRQAYAVAAGIALMLLAMVAGTRLVKEREGVTVAPAKRAAPTQKPGSLPEDVKVNRAKPSPLQSPPVRTAPQVQPPAAAPAQQTVSQPETGPAQGGEILRRVMPEILPRARNTIHGKVALSVRVDVDASGDVTQAAFESRGPSEYFARLSLDAAKHWKFKPQGAPQAWVLHFLFTRSGTHVDAVKASG